MTLRTRTLEPWGRLILVGLVGVWVGGVSPVARSQTDEPQALNSLGETSAESTADPSREFDVTSFVERFCLDCHNSADEAGGLTFEALANTVPGEHRDLWERAVRKLRARQMPPSDVLRPSEPTYDEALEFLESQLDAAAFVQPDPGRTATLRRLTRLEYRNAVRDLLGITIDVSTLLPSDSAGHGFDNVNVQDLSPSRLERYVTAAELISQLALGRAPDQPQGDTFRVPGDRTQEQHVEGLPLGTRGGLLIPYTFPAAGDYLIQVRLTRDRDEHIEGLHEPHEMEVLIDRETAERWLIKPPRTDQEHATADQHLQLRLTVEAGQHDVGVTFLKQPWAVIETKRQPLAAHFNRHRHPRLTPAVYEVSITGPLSDSSATPAQADSPSRRRLFTKLPASRDEEERAARDILRRLMRIAYRRPVTAADLAVPYRFFEVGRGEGGFALGLERAISAVLVNPNFLFRIEADPPDLPPRAVYAVGDLELASRLSFFLWSSLPDDELLTLAERGELSRPETLEQQVRRMLEDDRADSLIENFSAQWLYLRNLDNIAPNLRAFPDFDDNLRHAFRRETELQFERVVRQDLSVMDLVVTQSTFLNERLAKHYAIPHIYGSRFREVPLEPGQLRGGLLRQGSILTVTSYATRTSPVVRGNWVLENLLGTPAPPPPANVPALRDSTVSDELPIRERLSQHRADTACAGCHRLMDPIGFALENFDAVGRWRELEAGQRIDATGGLPDGSEFAGVAGLEQALLERPDLLIGTLAEKLLTYALGRGIEPSDAAAIRQVVRTTREGEDRFSTLIVAIVQSAPFRLRRTE